MTFRDPGIATYGKLCTPRIDRSDRSWSRSSNLGQIDQIDNDLDQIDQIDHDLDQIDQIDHD